MRRVVCHGGRAPTPTHPLSHRARSQFSLALSHAVYSQQRQRLPRCASAARGLRAACSRASPPPRHAAPPRRTRSPRRRGAARRSASRLSATRATRSRSSTCRWCRWAAGRRSRWAISRSPARRSRSRRDAHAWAVRSWGGVTVLELPPSETRRTSTVDVYECDLRGGRHRQLHGGWR